MTQPIRARHRLDKARTAREAPPRIAHRLTSRRVIATVPTKLERVSRCPKVLRSSTSRSWARRAPKRRRDPFLAAPFRLIDELMRTAGNGGNRVTGFTPLVDVHETEDEYLVKVDLPGVNADGVNVELNGQPRRQQNGSARAPQPQAPRMASIAPIKATEAAVV
jgi:hypothetical protein